MQVISFVERILGYIEDRLLEAEEEEMAHDGAVRGSHDDYQDMIDDDFDDGQ